MTKDPCMTKEELSRLVESQREEMNRKLADLEQAYPNSGMIQTWKLARVEFRLKYPMIEQIRRMHEEIC
jgi:hypothetical protein